VHFRGGRMTAPANTISHPQPSQSGLRERAEDVSPTWREAAGRPDSWSGRRPLRHPSLRPDGLSRSGAEFSGQGCNLADVDPEAKLQPAHIPMCLNTGPKPSRSRHVRLHPCDRFRLALRHLPALRAAPQPRGAT
jgi:hypothetical protein